MSIKWELPKKDYSLICRLTDRAMRYYASKGMKEEWRRVAMDITACHNNGCRLRLADWLAADEFNFLHDLFGIRNNLNRRTGKLDGLFLPRFAV